MINHKCLNKNGIEKARAVVCRDVFNDDDV